MASAAKSRSTSGTGADLIVNNDKTNDRWEDVTAIYTPLVVDQQRKGISIPIGAVLGNRPFMTWTPLAGA